MRIKDLRSEKITEIGNTIEISGDSSMLFLTTEQARWLWELRKTSNLEVFVWRPRHFEAIAEILR